MKCVIVPGILLGSLYSLFGVYCFGVSKQYEWGTLSKNFPGGCGVEEFRLDQYEFASGIIYYFAGLFLLFLSIFVNYDNPPRYIRCTWIAILLINIHFVSFWSVTGGVLLIMSGDNCQNIAYLLWLTAIIMISVVPAIGLGIPIFILIKMINE